jgi:hypothetical protein
MTKEHRQTSGLVEIIRLKSFPSRKRKEKAVEKRSDDTVGGCIAAEYFFRELHSTLPGG